MMKCPRCPRWEIKSGDKFCSWCGIKLLDILVTPGKMRFYIDKAKGECRHKNKIIIENRGWTEVKNISAAFDKALFSIPEQLDILKPRVKKEAVVDLLDSKNLKLNSTSTITIEFGGETHYIEAGFYYAPELTLFLEGEEVRQMNTNDPFKVHKLSPANRINFKLRFNGSTVFEAAELYVENVEGVERYALEKTKVGDSFIEGILVIDNEKLTLGMAEFVNLKIKGKYTEFESKFSFYIKLVIPPDFYLLVDGIPYKEGKTLEVEAYEGLKNEKKIKIINSSAEILTIAGITVKPPFKKGEFELNFPRILLPGADEILTLHIDMAGAADEKMESAIVIHTREIGDKTLRFLIKKNVAKEFEGSIAFDFGTTNNTVAYRQGSKTFFVPIEPAEIPEKEISSSVIRYERIVEGIPVKYAIGELARSVMILNPRSSVMAIKTHLGEKNKVSVWPLEESTGSVEYTPLEITTHIVKRLKEETENYLKQRVTRAAITHPSKFTHIQVEELKTAFRQAGIDPFETIEEPEAAALDYITQPRGDNKDSYVIGVFDCGGGTTDITMIEVRETRENQNRLLDVKVLATDGARDFGGNNLTAAMIEIILGKIAAGDFTADIKNKKGLKLYYKEEDERNEEMIKIMKPRGFDWESEVRRNRAELWQRAEKWKILLSNVNISEVKEKISLNFVNQEDGELVQLSLIFEIEKREFEAKINSKIEELVDKLKRMSGRTGKDFDLILLSGMSSQVPLIHRVLSDNFSSPVTSASELKKCVVSGALEYLEKTTLPGAIELKFNRGKQLRSAIGILALASDGRKKFHEVFSQGTRLAEMQKNRWIKLDFPLKRRMRIAVYTNMGTREYFDEADDEFVEITSFDIQVPDQVKDSQVRKGELFMGLTEDLKPRIFIKVGTFSREFS